MSDETRETTSRRDGQETWREVVAEMRNFACELKGNLGPKSNWIERTDRADDLLLFADRIEAAVTREELKWAKANGELAMLLDPEKIPTGNAAKLREALDRVHHYLGRLIRDDLVEDAPEASDMADEVWDALNEPPRNCDVGTPEEQAERFKEFCLPRVGRCSETSTCPAHHQVNQFGIQYCQLRWAQLPYEAPATPEKGGEK